MHIQGVMVLGNLDQNNASRLFIYRERTMNHNINRILLLSAIAFWQQLSHHVRPILKPSKTPSNTHQAQEYSFTISTYETRWYTCIVSSDQLLSAHLHIDPLLSPALLWLRRKFNLPAVRTFTPPHRIYILFSPRYLSGDSWRDRRLGDSLRNIDLSQEWLKTLPLITPVRPPCDSPTQLAKTDLSARTVGESTAPLTEKPPQADEETRNQIVDAAAKDPTGQTQGGQDVAGLKVKSEKECM